MDTSPSLAVAVDKLLKDVVKGPLIDNKGEFSTAKIAKPLWDPSGPWNMLFN